ncbi:tetraspanin-9-like [Mytilus californianus]|uniref:tetraspanin-9-like n=1 Tax=Mytilus californianus TaxID=6549 RepID=UPI002245700D|nr:tetraspanin-9-like [Mytilus californianus]XP_052066112.1 tetraspanin-9-like [Mytilus californianus]
MGSMKTSAFCTLKYIFIIFNALIWLIGCGLFSVGIWMQVNTGPYINLLPSHYVFGATAIICITGVVALIIGFCGLVGGIMESRLCMVVYFVFNIVVFAAEITIIAIGFSKKSQLQSFVKEELMYSLEFSHNPDIQSNKREGVDNVIDYIQQDLKCCGINNYTDWFNHPAWPGNSYVTDSCCLHEEEECGKSTTAVWFRRGCKGEIDYWFIQNMTALGISALMIIVLQVCTMAASLCLCWGFREDKFRS